MRTVVLVIALLPLVAGCGRDDAVPTGQDNAAMDAAANRLDNAADDLDQVNEQLPSNPQ